MADTLSALKASLSRVRQAAFAIAGVNLLLGLLQDVLPEAVARTLGLGTLWIVAWGVGYGLLAFFLPTRPSRCFIAVVVYLLLDGFLLLGRSMDVGGGIPWLGLAVRAGFTGLMARGAWLARIAAEEAYWAAQKPFVANLPPRAPRP